MCLQEHLHMWFVIWVFLGGQCCWSKLLHFYILSCWNLPCNLHLQHMSVQTNHISSAQQSRVTSDWTTGRLRLTSHTEMPVPWRQASYAPLLYAVLSRFSRVPLCAIPCTATHQALLSLGVSRQEYWSGCHALLQGIFPTQRWSLHLLSTTSATWLPFIQPSLLPKESVQLFLQNFPVFFRTPNNT